MPEALEKIEVYHPDVPDNEKKADRKTHLEIVKPSPREVEVELDQAKMNQLNKQTKRAIEMISSRVFSGEISIFDSAIEMGKLTRETLNQIAQEFAAAMNVEVADLPFSIFVFGATARNLMLPNSDLDIALIFNKDCPEAIKSSLRHIVSALPFNDETDIAHLESIEDMKKENCPSMMENNKAVEARFVTGNVDIAKQHRELIEFEDSLKDKEKRFMTEYWLLHKFDYGNRSSEHGMNLKYDFGGSRDVVFLDWYYALKAPNIDVSEIRPASYLCLDLLLKDNFISREEYDEMKSILELILLVKFTLWDENIKSNDEKLLHLSDSSIDKCFKSIETLLKKRGINNEDEFIHAYYRAKGQLHNLVAKLYDKVASSNPASRDLWENAKEITELDDEVRELFKNPSWHELVPFAIRSTSAEILHYMVERFGNIPGYEYILKIISQNKYITDEIKEDLLNSRLDKRVKYKLSNQ